jgi:hypothetical protein
MSQFAAMPTPRFRARAIRCACDHCGAHVIAKAGFRVAGSCGNCGSYEITPIKPAVVGRRTADRTLAGLAARALPH